MNCPDEGRWRAFMDHELPAEDQAALAEHLASCPACRVTMQALRGDAEACAAAMAQVQAPAPATAAAWKRFAAGQPAAVEAGMGGRPASDDLWSSLVWHISGFLRDTRRSARYGLRTLSWRLDTMSRNSQLRWQPALAAILVVAVLISIVTVAPLRAAASQFLDIFRVRHLAVVQVQTGQLQRLEQYRDQVFGKPQVERAQPIQAASAAEAGNKAGFRVLTPEFVPAGLSPETITVEGGGHAKSHVNLQAARTVLQMANLPTDAIPAGRDSLEVNATLKPGVALSYSNGTQSLVVVQSQSPEVDVPPDVNLNRVGEVGLELFGMAPADAQRFSRNIDWSSTLVLPVPANMASVQEVSLRGTTGYVITTTDQAAGPKGPRGPHTVVMWQENGLLYAVSGDFNRTMLLRVAESLK